MEDQIKYVKKVLTSLREMYDLSQVLDEKEFMQRGQALAEELTESKIAFIHFIGEDETSIDLVGWSEQTLATYCNAAYDSHYPVEKAGIWANALRTRQPVIVNDYETYPHKKGLHEGHARLERFISLPVLDNEKVVMLTGVGNKESEYTSFDVEVVNLISNEIWHYVKHRRQQDKLQALNVELDTLFESMNDAVFVYPFQESGFTKFVKVNHTACEMFGYSKEEFLKLTANDITTKDALARYDEQDKRAELIKNQCLMFESVQITKDGRLIPVEIRSRFISLGGQKMVLSTMRNITLRKKAEEALRASKRDHEHAQKIARLAHYHLDVVHGTWTNSPVLDDIFGIDEHFNKDVQGWLSLVHPEYQKMMGAYLQECFSSQHPFDKEYPIIHQRSGEMVWVHGHGDYVLDENGDVIFMFGTIQDVTESVKLRQKLEENEKMLVLQSRNAAMGEMISMIAHQWRQPLSIIVMEANNILLDIELGELQEEAVKKHVRGMVSRAQHLSKTIDDFRDFFLPQKRLQCTTTKTIFSGVVEFIQHVRAKDRETPVIMITAHTDKKYLLDAVELHMEKYIVKPIDTDELFEVLEKCVGLLNINKQTALHVDAAYVYDYDKKELMYNDEVIALNNKERDFLEVLISGENRVVSYDELQNRVWGDDVMTDSAVRSLVRNLRRKLPTDIIANVSGVGYKLV